MSGKAEELNECRNNEERREQAERRSDVEEKQTRGYFGLASCTFQALNWPHHLANIPISRFM
jgi:hypothetical protein